MARPCEYDPAIFGELMERLAAGETLKAICESEDKFPSRATVLRWVVGNVGNCSEAYTRAREEGIHAMIDETIEISDDTSRDTVTKTGRDGEEYEEANTEWIQRSRLRVDTRKWLASKIVPKIYGERIQQELSGKDGGPLTVSWLPAPPK